MFLGKSVLKICSKFTGQNTCRSVISIKLLCNFIKVTLRHGCSPENMLHIFRTPIYKNTYGGQLLLYSDETNIEFLIIAKSQHTVSSIWTCEEPKFCLHSIKSIGTDYYTAQKMKFSIRDFFSKCD